MKMIEREADVESHLVREVGRRGGRCVKFDPSFLAGWPDRIVILPGGILVWVELKRPKGGRVAALQHHAHRVLRDLGQRVELVYTKAEADELIADLLSPAAAAPRT